MLKPAGRRAPYYMLAAVAVAIHIVFLLSLHYHFLNPFFYIASHAKGQGGCFFGVYQAGVNLTNGESIYGCENYMEPAQVAVPFYHFYRYLPFTSYISSAASRILPPWPAYWTWIAVNEGLLVLCILLTLRLRSRFGNAAIAAASFWLLFSPFYVELYMGQFCFTMAFFIFVLLHTGLRRGAAEPEDEPACHPTGPRRRSWCTLLAPLFWICSVLLKSFTALYSLSFMRMGKKKLALTGIGAAVFTSVPYFTRRPDDLTHFLQLNFQPLPSGSMGGYFGFSVFLREISDRLLAFPAAGEILRLGFFDVAWRNVPLMLALACIIGLTLLITLRKPRLDPLGSIALWTLTFFLVFKDIWEYHYVMLLPLFVAYYLESRSKTLLVLFALIALPTPFILYDVPGSFNPQDYWSAPLSIAHHSFKAVPTLLFYIWVVRREIAGIGGLRGLLTAGRTPAGAPA